MKIFRKKTKRVYLDYASFTPSKMGFFESVHLPYANPGSLHKEGIRAKNELEESRQRVSGAIGAHRDEIVFTSTGTESNNLAIFGVVESALASGVTPHIVTSKIEHPSVLEPIKYLKDKGKITVTYLSHDEVGNISEAELKAALTKDTVLVTIMMVNNEIGTIFDTRAIAKIIRDFKKDNNIPESNAPYFLVDACQATNIVEIDVKKNHADLLTLNGSKIYAPGTAMLYKRREVKMQGVFFGGNQEMMLRPGTQNVSSISIFSYALEHARKNVDIYKRHTQGIKQIFEDGIAKLKEKYNIKLSWNSPQHGASTISNITFSGMPAELMVLELDAKGVYVSSMSACKEGESDVSHVLLATGKIEIGKENIGGVRFSFGISTSESDIEYTLGELENIIKKYKGIYF